MESIFQILCHLCQSYDEVNELIVAIRFAKGITHPSVREQGGGRGVVPRWSVQGAAEQGDSWEERRSKGEKGFLKNDLRRFTWSSNIS